MNKTIDLSKSVVKNYKKIKELKIVIDEYGNEHFFLLSSRREYEVDFNELEMWMKAVDWDSHAKRQETTITLVEPVKIPIGDLDE